MIIAVNTGPSKEGFHSTHNFIFELIGKCSLDQPQEQFYIIGSNHGSEEYSNLKFMGVRKPLLPFLKNKLYDKKISKVVEEISADLMISTDGYYCKNITVPQVLFVDENNWKNFSKTDLDLARSILVMTESTKSKLVSTFQTDNEKIINVHFGISDEIQPLNFEEQFIVKEDHTDGKEYFLAPYPTDKNILISLLKAFSVFKKRQQTNMILMLVSDNEKISDSFDTIIQNYKYRQDVILKFRDQTSQYYKLLGAAYAFIDLSAESLMPIAEAMKSDVPVLTSEKAMELTATAALFFETDDHQQIAEQMMLIYKDENLRSQIIHKAALIISEYTWDRTVELFWKAIK